MPGGSEKHWERLYRTKVAAERSWYESHSRRSLQAIQETGIASDASLLDVGGGASVLVDDLLKVGYSDITVLDIAPSALAQSRERLGAAAERVTWVEADVTTFRPTRRYALWHDRAVLHFLLAREEQEQYVAVLRSALARSGHVILATFGPDGPTRCSGLPVQRYSVEMISSLLGRGFELRNSVLADHRTPAGVAQQFQHTRWQAVD
jgi:trans-aconitate methyltransferase